LTPAVRHGSAEASSRGATELGLATHSNKSMVVLTDGNENVHPYVGELPGGTITNRTYAIGFGLPGNVSDAVLNQITSNTNGDLIVTGNISSAEQGFNLTKYFVQVLAGVTNMKRSARPAGFPLLRLGARRLVWPDRGGCLLPTSSPLCPVPQLIDFRLETPGGKIIKPTGGQPNVQYVKGQQVLFYRMTLPAVPGDPKRRPRRNVGRPSCRSRARKKWKSCFAMKR